MGRHSDYTQETALEICALIAEGKPLVTICRGDSHPDVRTVYRWLTVHEEFRQMYARAKEDCADTLADEIIDIADDGSRDYVDAGDGQIRVNQDHIQRSRLRVDARKWIASKLKPKKYGEKLELGGDATSPVRISLIDGTL